MSSIKVLELRPDRTLLNPKFDGYKLSLEPMAKLKVPLTAGRPDRCIPNDDQYSFMHAQLFSLHNHLCADPWEPYAAYFVDVNWTVQRIKYNENNGTFDSCRSVYSCGRSGDRHPGDYNYTLQFVSEKYSVLADGRGSLHLIDTGDRSGGGANSSVWKCISSTQPLGGGSGDDDDDANESDRIRFIIQDARFDILNEVRQINCILLHVARRVDEAIENNSSGFECHLDWIRLQADAKDVQKWTLSRVRTFTGSTMPAYCTLSTKCAALLVCSDSPFRALVNGNDVVDQDMVENGCDATDHRTYSWQQVDDEIVITFVLDRIEAETEAIKVVADAQRLHVTCHHHDLLNAQLYATVDSSLTTWQLENETLTMTLRKMEPSQMWPSLLHDELVAASDAAALPVRDPASLAANNFHSDMEECDFGNNDAQVDFFLGLYKFFVFYTLFDFVCVCVCTS